MIPTHVIILAQGTQKRLGGFQVPKQLLALPAHAATGADNWQILTRTIGQVGKLLVERREGTAFDAFQPHKITVVGWEAMRDALNHAKVPGEDLVIMPEVWSLGDPGNSSIKGMSRYFQDYDRRSNARTRSRIEEYPHTVVLLGDVVYSWACLRHLFRPPCPPNKVIPGTGDVTFAGTSDLGPGGGELWGVAWYAGVDELVRLALSRGLRRSSKHEEEYQPGQLRHWLWEIDAILNPPQRPAAERGVDRSRAIERDWWVAVDDYTMDVDLPSHLVDLARASLLALDDDRAQEKPRG